VCYLVENGQPVIQFIYDHKARGIFEKVVKILGSKVHDLADATPAEVLEFTNATSQDCA
jgi:allophanate hydrolase subunit 2